MVLDDLKFVKRDDPAELREIVATVSRLAPLLAVTGADEPQFDRAHFAALADLGLCGMHLPESHGGVGLGTLAQAAVIAALAELQLGPAIYLSVHQMVGRILAAADPTGARSDRLAPIIAGTTLAAFCLTEAGAGSDAQALQTLAKPTADGYELSGEKIYISSAPVADVFLVFARLESADGKISAFLVPRATAGVTVGPAERKMGCAGAPIASVHFDAAPIPASSLVGEPGGGFRAALSGLQAGRVSIAAAACGIATAALTIAVSHAQTRKQFGRPIADFQGLQFLVADCAMALHTAVLATRHAALALDRGDPSHFAPSAAKCIATDAAMRITTDCVQILGGAGYLSDYGVERLMRDAKMLQIVEGTNQIQRILVSRSLFSA